MPRSAVIFPGQGAQVVGMGRDVCAVSTAAKAVFDRAGDALGFDLAALCFEGPAEQLERTDIQQPAIFTVSAALWEALRESGLGRDAFAAAAGLSLGEYTALYVAGALDLEDAVRLVALRGRLMQAAAAAEPSGMVSLIGGDEAGARALCDAAREGEVLAPANFNCPGQIVLSGHRAACARAAARAEAFGFRAVPLAVAGAFHSPLMASAAEGLREALHRANWRALSLPVLSNVDAEYHEDGEAMRCALERQVTHPVLWQKCIERLIADGVQRFVEVGPGRVLTGLMRKINRQVEVVNVSSADSLTAAVAMPSG